MQAVWLRVRTRLGSAAMRLVATADARAPQRSQQARDAITAAQPTIERLRAALGVITPLGATVIAAGIASWIFGRRLGWVELMYTAAACLVLMLCCAVLTIGRTALRVELEVEPRRLVAGGTATGEVKVTNVARSPLLPLTLELPVGLGAARFSLPPLPPGSSYDDVFVIPTEHRGVIEVGPATTLRGDPFGLLRRSRSWSSMIELFVHPRTVALEPLGRGLLRDLEGQTTNDISMSDLAFHTLRDYAPGDDRRYIHWRSSAKVSASAPGGKLLVRQFLDTRRSHVAVIVDGDIAAYSEPDHFETAVSVGASVTLRALRDEMDTTVLAAEHLATQRRGPALLDAFARAQLGDLTLSTLVSRALAAAPECSVALLVTGAATDFAKLRQAASHFPPEVNVVAVRVDPRTRVGLSAVGSLTILNLAQLRDLPVLLQGVTL